MNRTLAVGGVVGPLLFTVAFTAAGFLRRGYSPLHQAISDLGIGPQASLLNVSLVLMGATLVGCGVALGRTVAGLGWICPALLALPGIGFAWAGIFTEAPETLTLHWVVGMPLVGIGSIAGFLITGLRLRRAEGWRGFGAYSIAASIVTFLLMMTMFATWTLGFGGLTERVFFLEILVWYAAAGWRLSSRT